MIIGKYHLAYLWRIAYRGGISDIQLAADGYDNRYPFRVADIEVGDAGSLAFRQPGDGQRQFGRLPVPGHERDLDLHRRLLDLPDSPVFRVAAVHHDYWYSFRQTAFQDGCIGSFAVRKEYRLRERDHSITG